MKKDVLVYRSVAKETGTGIPIDVAYEGNAATSKLTKSGGYSHTLKLDAPASFTVLKTVSGARSPPARDPPR